MPDFSRRKTLGLLATIPAVLAIPARAATTHTVEIKGFSFSPATLTIAAGDTVTFVNKDAAPHTASDRGGAFDTGRLKKGQSAQITFSSKGKFNYFCRVHPRMKATLSVT